MIVSLIMNNYEKILKSTLNNWLYVCKMFDNTRKNILSHCCRSMHYKISGIKRKPKRYLFSLCKRFFTEFLGLFGIGIFSCAFDVFIDSVKKIIVYINRIPFDIYLIYRIFRDCLYKIISLLNPYNLARRLLSLPMEIRHINARFMAFVSLYWNEFKRLMRLLKKPQRLLENVIVFCKIHFKNKNRIIRNVIAVLCTIFLIRIFILISSYLYLIIPALFMIYAKSLIPIILNFLAGLSRKFMGRVILRQLKRRFEFLRKPYYKNKLVKKGGKL